MLHNITRSKDKQAIKFGQLREWNVKNIFLQKLCRKWGRETSSRPLFLFLNVLFKVKTNGHDLRFNIFWKTWTWTYNKNKLYNILCCWSRDVLNFHILWKSLGLAFPPHFVYDFSRKIFLILYSTNWSSFIVWLFHCFISFPLVLC